MIEPTTTPWTAEQVAGIAVQQGWQLPVLTATDIVSALTGKVVWDMWQIMDRRGRTVMRNGRSFWFFLAAPRTGDPDSRHDVARIRLTSFGSDGWHDHGETFPDDFTPGSREWSGSSVLADDGTSLTMYFTASGRRGKPRTFEQRLFESSGSFAIVDGRPEASCWSAPRESVRADGHWYRVAAQAEAVNGRIKGFRDPGYFRDPADGAEYLLFVGSAGWEDAVNDGVIGLARRQGTEWTLLPPLVTALGVNSELERPHVVVRAGLYYLFWSTQALRFSADAPAGVTGLYAMVATSMAGPWRPANDTGLVAGNPRTEPFQAYCWWVTDELTVASFVDFWGLGGADPAAPGAARCEHFGGVPAPFFDLAINGDRIAVASTAQVD